MSAYPLELGKTEQMRLEVGVISAVQVLECPCTRWKTSGCCWRRAHCPSGPGQALQWEVKVTAGTGRGSDVPERGFNERTFRGVHRLKGLNGKDLVTP